MSYHCIATALHPRLRLKCFKPHWRSYAEWHKKAEGSINDVYKEYLENENESDQREEELSQPNRRKVPGESHDTRFDDSMSVELHLLTGHHGYKKQNRHSQLQEYFEAIAIDLRIECPEYQSLLSNS